jgi:hypothetical protein
MTRPGPWSVKGVDDDARKIAREAASREGLTVGTWIDRAIRARTGDQTINQALENSESSLPDQNLDHPVHPAPTEFAGDYAPEPIAAPELPVAEETFIEGSSDDRLHLQKLTKADGDIDLFPSTPRPEEQNRSLPRLALTAILFLVIGGLGAWVYLTIEPGGSTPSPNQVASASSPSDEKRPTKAAAEAGPKAGQQNSKTAALESVTDRRNSRLAQLRAVAEKGDVRAQLDLGVLHMKGEDGRKDPVLAARWFAKAAEQGDPEALYNLGLLHENGEGMPKDQQKAAVFYARALAAGSANAAAKTNPVRTTLKTIPTAARTAKLAAVNPAAGQSAGSPTPPEARPGSARPLNAMEIAELQRLLSRLDIASEEPDGILGQRTVDAIKMYQRFAGLPVDGQPTATLLNDLKQVVGAMGTGQSTGK